MASSEEEWEVGDDGIGVDSAAHRDDVAKQTTGTEAQANNDSDGVASDAECGSSAEKSPLKSTRSRGKATTRKRGRSVVQSHHDDDDFESQPTITKWFRQVPGPLHDVMKKQHADLQQSLDDDSVMASGRSSGHAVHISTVFDHGAWVDMCDSLGMATSPGELYGGIKMSSLKPMVAHIQETDEPTPHIPRLLVLLKSMRYVDDEIVAIFHDPSGDIDGYFHREIVEQVGPALVKGTAVVLREVSVFTPSGSAVGGASKRFLNITPRNLQAVFPATTVAMTMEAIVRVFNESQHELIQAEMEADEEEKTRDEESSAVPRPRVLAPADVRNTTTELSFISQRQVVQRHEPVRRDLEETTTESGDGAPKQKKKTKKSKTVDTAPTGLGRWQWHTLAQKKPQTAAQDNGEESQEPRRHFPSGRFTELLSQHIQARRTAAAHGGERRPAAVAQPRSQPTAQSAPSKVVRFTTIQETTIDEEEDDDDW